jgi:hypothetical protein
LGATPAVEFASKRLKLFNFLEGAPIEVAHVDLEALTVSGVFFDCEFLKNFLMILLSNT